MKTSGNILTGLMALIFSISALIAPAQEEGWQWQNPYLQGNDLNSIVMNGSIGWAVGAMGTVMKTANEGFDWEMVDLGTSETFSSIYMDGVSGRGWIVSYEGSIYYTENGGEAWVKQRSGTTAILSAVTAISGDCPWICGNDIILKSHDHGNTWERVSTIYHSYFLSIDLKDCNEAWVSGLQGMVISTTDEGVTWESHPTATSNQLFCIDIVANGDYRACGYSGTILKSSDQGATWTKEYEQTFLYLYNVDTKGIGGPSYAVGGDGTILETLDGGTTWNKRESGVFTYLNDVCFQAIMHGVYVAGWYGVILRKEDAEGAEFEIMNESPIHFMTGMDFLDKNTGWAVGGKEVDDDTDEGIIMRTNDGGNTWEVQKTFPDYFMGIDFINENEGWVVGDNGAIKHTINGGETWTSQTSPIAGLMTAVFFINGDEGWIVSRDNWGEIAHTTNGGNTWTLQPEYSLNPLNDVFFINPDTGWIVGMDTTVMRTVDGGQNWLNCNVDVYGNPYMRSVQFIDEHKGWAVGTGGSILMSEDGGVNWFEINTEFSDLLQSVYFTDPMNGWACGTDGYILRTIDGGYTWFRQYSGAARYFTAICFADPMNGWVSGEGGMIKGTNNGGFWNEPGVFHKKGLNKPILDNADTKDTISVKVLDFRESGYEMVGLEVMLDSIIHPNTKQLNISLSHDGAGITLVLNGGIGGPDFLWTRLKDDAGTLITEGKSPFSGNYKPSMALYNFNHFDPDGEWILTIHDGGGGNTGTLKAWGIKPLFEKPLGVGDPKPEQHKSDITLSQNIPNPFTGRTRINWSSEKAGRTTLKIYDNRGRELETLLDEFKSKGEYDLEFDGSNYSPGVYYYQLSVGDEVLTKKCIIW